MPSLFCDADKNETGQGLTYFGWVVEYRPICPVYSSYLAPVVQARVSTRRLGSFVLDVESRLTAKDIQEKLNRPPSRRAVFIFR